MNKRLLSRMLTLLTADEKRNGALVLTMMIALAAVETVGVASIMPFLAVLGNPEMVQSNTQLRWLYERGSFQSVDGFLFALGLGAVILVACSAVLRVVTTYAVQRYVHMREYALGVRLLETYLRQPYEFFLNRNSSDLSKSLLMEVKYAISLAIKPGMEVLSYGLVALMLIALLVAIDPVVAGAAGVILALFYGTIYLATRGLLRQMGSNRIAASRGRFKTASEAFGGIKDLKVLGREQGYLARFREPAREFARYQYLKGTLAATPKYLVEAIAFGGILGIALFLMMRRENLGTVLPLLGVYAFAGYRLLPAAQHIFASLSSIRFGAPAVEAVYDDLTKPVPAISRASGPPIVVTKEIRFRDVTFYYAGAESAAAQSLNLVIPARTAVGVVGRTGAGKTTAVDLLLGLLEPTEGEILIDGVPLKEIDPRRWQRAIGYVPQVIYLADASVAENIAFGIATESIDREAVERATRIARLHEFVTELPLGYDTIVGERGVRLSGGQRQRIGIARALYHDPHLLVFDEATNSVDMNTERSLMDALEGLSGEKTLIIVAHRLRTVEKCDQVVVFEGGRIVGTGRFDDLKKTNQIFREIAVA